MKLTETLSFSRYEWAAVSLKELPPVAPSLLVSGIGAGDGRMRSITEIVGDQWQGFDLVPQLPEINSWNLDHPAPSVMGLLPVRSLLNNAA